MSNCRRFWTFSKSAKNRNEYYKVLGVSKDASKQEIKEAYLKLSKSLHPDVNKSPNASQEFQKLKEAFDNLSEPSGFHSYDKDDSLKVIILLKFYKFYRPLFFIAFVGL